MHKLTLVLLLLASVAHAEGAAPVQDIPPGDDQIVPVMEGKIAPFTGQLFSQETALRWANWLSQYKLRLEQDVVVEQKICIAELQYKDAIISAEADRNKTIQTELRVQMLRVEQYNAKLNDKINNPSFFGTTGFGVILGVVGASIVAAAVGVAAAAN